MARAVLVYRLPEEESDFRSAMQGRDAKLVLWSFEMYLRNRLKYEPLSKTVYAELQAARDELRSMLEEHSVSLDD